MSLTRAEAKQATRALLIAAAKAAFTADGFGAVGMRDVATDAGVSTGAIFNNFANKEALWEAAMGCPAPDVPAFLKEIEGADQNEPVGDFQEKAETLRRHLLGSRP